MDKDGVLSLAQSASANTAAEIAEKQILVNMMAGLIAVIPSFTDDQLVAFNNALVQTTEEQLTAADVKMTVAPVSTPLVP